MGKLILVSLLALSLSGCVGFVGGVQSAGQLICSHEFESRAALGLALEKATLITDPTRREAALAAIRVSLAALDACPKERL